jgi:hypothetical protein
MTGKSLRNFPGDMCLFFDNGNFLSATIKGLGLYDKKFNQLWHIAGNFHHQMNLSEDGQRILVLSSDLVKRKKENVRVNKFMVLSLEGKVLFHTNADELFKKAGMKETPRNDGDHILEEMKVKNEISHFNSFYEVPEIDSTKPSFLKKGALVVNGRGDGILFLNPDLQSVLKHVIIVQSNDHKIHDAQILKNGHLLLTHILNGTFIYSKSKKI